MASKKDLTNDEKNIHEGHRHRLIETVTKVGLEGLSKIQVVEYILFYIFPRGDVNPLAHRLLNKFNDVSSIFEASVEDLADVRGMGEVSAMKLHNLFEIFSYYITDKVNNHEAPKTIGEFYDNLEQLLRFKRTEELYLFGVNSSGEILKGRKFTNKSHNEVAFNMTDVALYLSTSQVTRVFVAHNHPDGLCTPSEKDYESFEEMKKLFSFSNITLIDSLVVGKDGIFSMVNNEIHRKFSAEEESWRAVFQEDLTSLLRD